MHPDAGQERKANVDEAILLIFRAPHSYTREDVVEIQGHGGTSAARRILECVLAAGARPADAGEFTKRAFLNGRIDLVQAEAVLDLIRARSDRAASAAVEQLDGALTSSLLTIYDTLLATQSLLEATLDFDDADPQPEAVADAVRDLLKAREGVDRLLETWHDGHILREGALVVISGKPNAGKSTLFNRMLGKERAIVTRHPGTTRDTIEETLVLNGYPLRLVDTAGLRDSACEIEREGITRAEQSLRKADLSIYVVDGSQALQEETNRQIEGLDKDHSLVILNKSDLGQIVTPTDLPNIRAISLSMMEDIRVEQVTTLLASLLGSEPVPEACVAISSRHRALLLDSLKGIDEAGALLDPGKPESVVLAANLIRAVLEKLGQLTGRVYHDELLDSIFSRFCIGK